MFVSLALACYCEWWWGGRNGTVIVDTRRWLHRLSSVSSADMCVVSWLFDVIKLWSASSGTRSLLKEDCTTMFHSSDLCGIGLCFLEEGSPFCCPMICFLCWKAMSHHSDLCGVGSPFCFLCWKGIQQCFIPQIFVEQVHLFAFFAEKALGNVSSLRSLQSRFVFPGR